MERLHHVTLTLTWPSLMLKVATQGTDFDHQHLIFKKRTDQNQITLKALFDMMLQKRGHRRLEPLPTPEP